MRKTVHSLGHSLRGLKEAWRYETNFRRFVIAHTFILVFCWSLGVDVLSLVVLTFAAAFLGVVELLNTAIERLADTVDDRKKTAESGHFHPGIKMTKDVAASASLIALIIYAVLLAMMMTPYVLFWYYGLAL